MSGPQPPHFFTSSSGRFSSGFVSIAATLSVESAPEVAVAPTTELASATLRDQFDLAAATPSSLLCKKEKERNTEFLW